MKAVAAMRMLLPSILLFSLATTTGLAAQAADLSQTVVNFEGRWRISNALSCAAEAPNVCQSLCGGDQCQWFEPFCRDCFGSSNSLIRDVVQNLTDLYVEGGTIESLDFLSSFRSRPTILVGLQSPYDSFNSSKDRRFEQDLIALCGSKNGFVAIQLGEADRPQVVVGVICHQDGQLSTRRLIPIGARSNDFGDGIKLKMEIELTRKR